MKYPIIILILFVCAGLLANPAKAAYYANDELLNLTTETPDDAFVAGEVVSITAPVIGELFSAGKKVTITKRAARSIYALGNEVTIEEGAGYNAFVAGNKITLGGQFGHDVYIAGNAIIIAEGTVINGDLLVAGETVTINGTVMGDVKIGANKFTSNAVINGSVSGEVEKLVFTGGSIGKDLTYRSDADAIGLDKVKIAGKSERQKPTYDKGTGLDMAGFFTAALFAAWFYKLLSTLLLGAVLVAFFPKKIDAVSSRVLTDWVRSLLAGLLALIVIPLIGIILLISIVGWPVATIIFMFYVVLLLVAPVYGTFAAGKWILNRLGDPTPTRWAALLVGAVVIAIISAIPGLGFVVTPILFLILTLPALGATLLWLREHIN